MTDQEQELPGMLALAEGVKAGEWPHTIDPQVWARKWLEITKDKPGAATDEGAMIGWFATAIMAGYDSAMTAGGSEMARQAALERDAERLSWLLQNLRGADLYFLIGWIGDDMQAARAAIDAAMQGANT